MTTNAPFPVEPRSPVRFRGVAVPDSVIDQLGQVCALDVAEDTRASWSRDWWPLALIWSRDGIAAALAAAVARPRSTNEVAEVARVCNESRIPLTVAGGRSGVCGASIPVHGGVVLDTTALTGIRDVDDESLIVEAGAGTYGHVLGADLADRHALTIGHWPQSVELSTVGGWIACRSAGQYSTRYGKIEDIVTGLEVVLASGDVVRTGAGPRAAAGPDLTQMFLGSEGTLGVVTGARLRAHPLPAHEWRGAFAFETFAAGLDACRRILRRGATPAVLRLYDERESRRTFDLDGRCGLIALDEGDPVIVDAVGKIVETECAAAAAEPLDVSFVQRWLDHRNDVSGLEAAIGEGFVVDTLEVAARWSVLTALYEDGVAAAKAVEGCWVTSAHQSHAYPDGACLYFTFAGKPEEDDRDVFYRAVWDAITATTLRYGGALSHHHGVGLNRARYMADALGSVGLGALQSIKASLDPNGILNPGKLGLSSPFGPPVWP